MKQCRAASRRINALFRRRGRRRHTEAGPREARALQADDGTRQADDQPHRLAAETSENEADSCSDHQEGAAVVDPIHARLSPIRRRHRAVAEDDSLAGEAFVHGEAALFRHTFFYGSRGAEFLGAFHDADPTAGADADTAAGVAEGGVRATGCVEKRFVRFRIRGLVERDEPDVHRELIESLETFASGQRLLHQTWRM